MNMVSHPTAFNVIHQLAKAKFIVHPGNWRGIVPIPHRSTFENLERQMEGEEQARFLDFMRSLLGWEPEKRLTAKQALSHPWLLNDRYM